MLRWNLSHSFKDDINTNYGTYQEGEDAVMEAIDRNMEYEQHAPAREERNERQVSGRNWEEMYDRMYEAWEPGELSTIIIVNVYQIS